MIADVATLQSLPPEEFVSGMAEVIKHALISNNTKLLESVEQGNWSVKEGELLPSLVDLQNLVAQAIQVKIHIIQEDPFEKERRLLLNFGHTFGHAIEHASGYSLTHGAAVAIGMVAATNLSARLGFCHPSLQERVESILQKNGLPTRLPPEVQPDQLLAALGHDKKRKKGRLRFVLIRDIGDVFVTDTVDPDALHRTLETIALQGGL